MKVGEHNKMGNKLFNCESKKSSAYPSVCCNGKLPLEATKFLKQLCTIQVTITSLITG